MKSAAKCANPCELQNTWSIEILNVNGGPASRSGHIWLRVGRMMNEQRFFQSFLRVWSRRYILLTRRSMGVGVKISCLFWSCLCVLLVCVCACAGVGFSFSFIISLREVSGGEWVKKKEMTTLRARACPPSSHTKAQKLGLDFSPSFASWKSLDYFFRPALSHKNSRISNVWVPRDLSVRDSLNTIKKKKRRFALFLFLSFQKKPFRWQNRWEIFEPTQINK